MEDNRRNWEVCNVSPEAGMVHHGGNCCMALSVVHEEHARTIEVDQLVLGVGKEAGYNHQKSMVALYPTKETSMKPPIRDNKGDIESHTADRKKNTYSTAVISET